MRKLDPNKLLQFHNEIATKHKEVNGFYRFNWNEIEGKFRSGIGTPALLMESHSSILTTNTNKVANFNNHSLSLLVLDFTGKPNNFDKQDQVLNNTWYIVMDIVSYLIKENKNPNSFLHMLFNVDSVRIEKVGPIFDNMYGWNLLYSLKNQEPFCFESNKWDE